MALQTCGLNLNRNLQEMQPHGTQAFPCAGFASYHTEKPCDVIPWHWHEEMELIFIQEGAMEIHVPSQCFHVKKGDALMINGNVLHYGKAIGTCELRSIVFHPNLIMGSEATVYAQKYMLPLLSCEAFLVLYISSEKDEVIIQRFLVAFTALAQSASGFEFIVRENLSLICFFLYTTFKKAIAMHNDMEDQGNARMKKMLTFIHVHFAETITLTDIAKAADISQRECLRCFKKTVQLSPMQYVLKYRLMQGAAMLTQGISISIAEIAGLCGFDSPSHFSNLFKRMYLKTPKQYRETKEQDSECEKERKDAICDAYIKIL